MSSGDVIDLRYLLELGDFSLDVELKLPLRGISGVFGESGSGKTSLLRCVAGLAQPGEGRLIVAGDAWQDSRRGICRAVHERNIGYVFQEPRLFSHLDVRGNLDYGRKRRRPGSASVNVDQVVSMLGLETLMQRRPADLSGGEAQRVSIARALLRAPRFVLMDEPLASLDRARKDEVLPFLDRLHAELAVPIVYVSHSIDEICRLCDHLVVLDDGRAMADGGLIEVLSRLDVPVLNGQDAGTILETTVTDYDAADDLSRLRFSGGEFLVAGRAGASGERQRLRIHANDISLCRERPAASTILNIIPVEVETLAEVGRSMVLVRLKAGSDTLVARISRRSCREMGLSSGDKLLAQVKSAAIRSRLPDR